jgi:maltooligosyltrehalose trehalohydrolase
VPRIPGARAEAASALGTTGVQASWRMGDGALLSIAVNFGESDLDCPLLPGTVLFETTPGITQGRLPKHSAVVRLQETLQETMA